MSQAIEQVNAAHTHIAHYQAEGEVAQAITLQIELHYAEIERETALVDGDLYARLHAVYTDTVGSAHSGADFLPTSDGESRPPLVLLPALLYIHSDRIHR